MKNRVLVFALLLVSLFCSFQCDDNPVNNEGSITIITPNGGEQWQIGIRQQIKWTSQNISGDVKIEISYDGGVTYSPLISGTVNDGQESWNVLGAVSTRTMIRILSLTDSKVSDEADNTFTIFEVVPGPKNLTAVVSAAHDISLTWQDQSTTEQGFIVERRIGLNGAWVERVRLGANVVTYKDSLLSTNWEYCYRVRAYTPDGISGETNEVSKILGWVQQVNSTTQTLYGIAYLNGTTGIAVGENGTVLRTVNGGDYWQSISSGTGNTLYGVAFANTSTGVAVGAQGIILHTNDGGASWSVITVGGANYHFKGVEYATANDVYAVGYRNDQFSDSTWGVIVRSTDGGANWASVFEQWRYKFESVSFPVQDVGTVVGSVITGSFGAIFRTTNRGQFWSKQSNETSYPLFGVYMSSANTGTAVGTLGTILHTVNGGTNWDDQSIITNRTLRNIGFADASRGMIIGDNGTAYRTTDGGSSWFLHPTGTTQNYYGLFLNNTNTQTIVGANGAIVKTDNGGAQ